MDYEKKYKEALNWMKDVYPTLEGAAKEDAEHYFPELTKDKDERIRKAIRTLILSEPDIYKKIGFSQSDCLVWIEKQGEKTFDMGKSNLLTVERAMEISPFMKSGFENESVGWSEEDEKMLNDTLDILSGYFSSTDDVVLCDNINKAEKWLESIKDRMQPQNLLVTDEELIKARNEAYNDALDKLEYHSDTPTFNDAWSEEDKRKINRIYSILGQAADTHAYSTTCRLIGDKECIELQDFLKSLKDGIQPQSQWKPSGEQMYNK